MFATVSIAAPPDAMQFGAEVRAGRVDPASHDFAAAGFWELEESQRKVWPFLAASIAGREGVNPGSSCDPVDRRAFELLAWSFPASQSASAEQWREARAQLVAALAALDRNLDAEAAAAKADPGKDDPKLAELRQRFAKDQAIRRLMFKAAGVEALSPIAASSWGWLSNLRMIEIDCDNTRWLKQQLETVRWFDIPRFGADADDAAWHLVQHADREPSFQRDMLALLQSLPKHHTSQKRIGYLWDRVAGQEGRPQRFGTQGVCQPDGSWKPNPVEEPGQLDDRRRALGLEPIAEHALVVAREACPQPAAK